MPGVQADEADAEAGQPEVVFRCEGGRLGAYVVTTAYSEGGLSEEHTVPISLDSAPSCDQ